MTLDLAVHEAYQNLTGLGCAGRRLGRARPGQPDR